MKKGQSNRLTMQQKEGQGPVTIFHKDAQIHDAEVGNTSLFVKKQLEYEFPMLTFRYSAVYGVQRSPFCFRAAVFRSQRPPIFC